MNGKNSPIFITAVIGIAIGIAVGAFFGYDIGFEKAVREAKEESGQSNEVKTWATFLSDTLGLSFAYRTFPDGYMLIENETESEGAFSYKIMKRSDYRELQESTEPREGPPVMTIEEFPNPGNRSLEDWIKTDRRSNYALQGEEKGGMKSEAIGGKNAIRYSWSGLYEGDSVAVIHQGSAVVMSVTYFGPGDQIRKDFEELLTSIRFIEE